jgi:hypothetical protein
MRIESAAGDHRRELVEVRSARTRVKFSRESIQRNVHNLGPGTGDPPHLE